MNRKTKSMMIIGAVALLAVAPTFPQNAELQQNLAAGKAVCCGKQAKTDAVSIDRDTAADT